MTSKFEAGQSYVGTATVDHSRKKIFQVVKRSGNGLHVCIQPVRAVRREVVDVCDGTEYVRIKDDDGFDYFLSANVPVDVDVAFAVMEMCR